MTRVVIEETGNPANMLVLVNRSDSLMQGPPDSDEWYLRADGLDDSWYSPTDSRAALEEDPSGDGAFWPDEYLLTPRTFPVRGAMWARSSSLSQGAARARLARLHNKPLTVLVEDEMGPRWVHGFSRQRPIITRPSIHRVEFTLFISCPSPVKTGREVRFPTVATVAQVENSGDYPTWPVFYAPGPVTVIASEFDGHVFAWAGNSPTGVTLDPQTGIVTNGLGVEIGGIQVDDVFRVPPGAHELTVESDAAVTVGVRPGWL